MNEAAACGFWFVLLKRITSIRNFQKTATRVSSFLVDSKPVGSTLINTTGQYTG